MTFSFATRLYRQGGALFATTTLFLRQQLHFLLFLPLLALSIPAQAQQLPTPIPADLAVWQDWVLAKHPQHPCPWLGEQHQQCQWSETLSLIAGAEGGSFSYQLVLFAEGWVSLPGDVKNWPLDVQVVEDQTNTDRQNGTVATVRDNNGVPEVYLGAGRWKLRGEFHWQELPLSIRVPEQSGILKLQLSGKDISDPKRLGTELWLQQQQVAADNSTDQLQIKVFRLFSDDIPASLTTLLQLDVSGKAREITLDAALLQGFSASALQSDLPVLLNDKGQLTLQLSAGQYQVQLEAVSHQRVAQLKLPVTTAPWPGEEIWAFVAKPSLRTVDVTGVASLDPNQTRVPPAWQQYPLYAMAADSTLQLTELQRGGGSPVDQLRLEKQLWLDFNNAGITVADQISGQLHSQARLEVQSAYQLGRAELNGEAQLITQLPQQQAGIELRQNPLQLKTISRTELNNRLPVSGWQSSFSEVSWQLNLPPGWSLITATGADRIDGSVLEQWTLWDIFFVLLFSVACARLFGWQLGLLALATLLLSYQRFDAPQWSWLSLLALLALLPLAKGKAELWLKKAAYLNVLILLIIVVPFAVNQIRQAIYPQLELSYLQLHPDIEHAAAPAPAYAEAVAVASAPVQEAPQQAAPVATADSSSDELAKQVSKKSQVRLKMAHSAGAEHSGSLQPAVLQRDPNARIQTGPAEPAWHWQQVQLFWQGPLLAEEQTRLYLVPAWLNRLGNLLTVLMLLLLLWQLCQPLWATKFNNSGFWTFIRTRQQLMLLGLLLPCYALLQSPMAQAGHYPDEQLLAELEQRLLQPPLCLPVCSSLNTLALSNSNNNIKLTMQLDSQAPSAWALPVPAAQLLAVQLNQQNAAIFQQQQQSWLMLPAGRHQLELWILATEPSLVLNFDTAWHQLTDTLNGWRIVPDSTNLQDADALQQSRKQLRLERLADKQKEGPANTKHSTSAQQNLPAFAVLERHLTLGLEWQMTSTLRRVGQSQQALQLQVPLLDGETPLSPLPVLNAVLQLQLNANQQTISWQSSLKQNTKLKLNTPLQQQYTEIWQLAAAPKWHVQSAGLAAVAQVHSPLPSLWQPWPGEALTLNISQPEAVAGEMLTIHQVALKQQQGNRSSDVELTLQLNASQAQKFSLPLPQNALLQAISLDGVALPLTVNQQQLTLQLKPGRQQLQLNFKENNGQSLLLHSTELTLPLAAANIYLQLALAPDRWILALGGPSIGPALLFWGMLAVMLLLALILPAVIQSPLRRRHWLLLFAGICTVSFWIPLLVSLWLLAVSKRGQLHNTLQGSYARLSQLGLILLTLSALLALFSAIPYGLLSAPDMQLVGNGSYQQQLYWYQDFSQPELPQAWVLSLPLWCYQLAMLLWSLWLATALTRWLPWVWQQLSKGGFWPAAPLAQQNNKPEPEQKD